MESRKSTHLGLSDVLFTVFFVLKLTDNIAWSWWWVMSPIWITFIARMMILAIQHTIVWWRS